MTPFEFLAGAFLTFIWLFYLGCRHWCSLCGAEFHLEVFISSLWTGSFCILVLNQFENLTSWVNRKFIKLHLKRIEEKSTTRFLSDKTISPPFTTCCRFFHRKSQNFEKSKKNLSFWLLDHMYWITTLTFVCADTTVSRSTWHSPSWMWNR